MARQQLQILARDAILLADADSFEAAIAYVVPHRPDVETELRGNLLNGVQILHCHEYTL
jgi:hypothetical protein